MIDSELWLGEHVTKSPWAKLLQEEMKALKQEVRVQKTAVEAYREAYLQALNESADCKKKRVNVNEVLLILRQRDALISMLKDFENEEVEILGEPKRIGDIVAGMEESSRFEVDLLRQAFSILTHVEEEEHGISEKTSSAVEQWLNIFHSHFEGLDAKEYCQEI